MPSHIGRPLPRRTCSACFRAVPRNIFTRLTLHALELAVVLLVTTWQALHAVASVRHAQSDITEAALGTSVARRLAFKCLKLSGRADGTATLTRRTLVRTRWAREAKVGWAVVAWAALHVTATRLAQSRALLTTVHSRLRHNTVLEVRAVAAGVGARRPFTPVVDDTIDRARLHVAVARLRRRTANLTTVGGIHSGRARTGLRARAARLATLAPSIPLRLDAINGASLACASHGLLGRTASSATIGIDDNATPTCLNSAAARLGARCPAAPI